MMKLLPVLFCSCILVTAPMSTTAKDKQDTEQPAQSKSRVISKETATQLAQQRYPGRILKVHTEQKQYKVRVMQTDGRVVNVVVDGQNGRVRREE